MRAAAEVSPSAWDGRARDVHSHRPAASCAVGIAGGCRIAGEGSGVCAGGGSTPPRRSRRSAWGGRRSACAARACAVERGRKRGQLEASRLGRGPGRRPCPQKRPGNLRHSLRNATLWMRPFLDWPHCDRGGNKGSDSFELCAPRKTPPRSAAGRKPRGPVAKNDRFLKRPFVCRSMRRPKRQRVLCMRASRNTPE